MVRLVANLANYLIRVVNAVCLYIKTNLPGLNGLSGSRVDFREPGIQWSGMPNGPDGTPIKENTLLRFHGCKHSFGICVAKVRSDGSVPNTRYR